MEIQAIRNIFEKAATEESLVHMTDINRILPEKVTPTTSSTVPEDLSLCEVQDQSPSSSRRGDVSTETKGISGNGLGNGFENGSGKSLGKGFGKFWGIVQGMVWAKVWGKVQGMV